MKKILIISQYIAPVRAIASVRWTKMAKYLKLKHDVEITVLTNEKKFEKKNEMVCYHRDSLLEKDLVNFDQYITFRIIKIGELLYRIKKSIKRTPKRITNTDSSRNIGSSGEKQFARSDFKHRFNSRINDIVTEECVIAGFKKYKQINKKFDVVISTYGPVWPHIIAKKIKEEDPSIFWLADFRDIYAGNSYESKSEFEKHKKFVSTKLKLSDIITKVSPELNLFESENQKVVTLSNGYDDEERLLPMPPKIFSFVYTGSFYPGETDLRIVFRAIKELVDSNKIAAQDVKIIYAGNSGDEFTLQADEAGIGGFVINKGPVNRTEALELQQYAAILLQSYCYSSGFKSLWSGKMYEYMMIRKPIVFAVNGDIPSAQYKLMPKLGGIAVENCREKETYDDMKKYILEKYQEWKESGNVTIVRDEEYVESFSYSNLADSVWQLIKGEEDD